VKAISSNRWLLCVPGFASFSFFFVALHSIESICDKNLAREELQVDEHAMSLLDTVDSFLQQPFVRVILLN